MKLRITRTALCAAMLASLGILTACKTKAPVTPYEQTLTQEGTKDLCAGLDPRSCQQKVLQLQAKHKADLQKQAEEERLQKLPQADASVPDAQYVPVDSGYQLAAMFYALSGMPPDYEVLASAASQEYRTTTDQFRKRDLLQALHGKIDQDIARYKDPQNRYITMEDQGLPIQHYDFKTSSFPVNLNIGPDAYNYFNDSPQYKLAYNNGEKFLHFPVADQQRAKEIESMVTKNELYGGDSTFYVFVQEAYTANNTVKGQIVRVALKDRKHGEIARY
jgi:hypothetical protein